MPRHYSTSNMVERLVGLLDTTDLNEFEHGFVESMQRRLNEGTLTGISDRQVEVLENVFNKHFA
ncbi:hypothetical protein M3I54_22750 [Paraburkholderia sp. CNPSo 3274]|uniref:hypothetical protein n=1 Tax=Paraburkholderia sp. CNPSo 3274 TaxID=2940932 RepID=UPI0020B67791|nr:hypothetical protein [Paraburkholderia sp. CNPSo 3274]MCP3709767.1 hypothetical protein [Paraburkholderia sp. CNPSo 3274]